MQVNIYFVAVKRYWYRSLAYIRPFKILGIDTADIFIAVEKADTYRLQSSIVLYSEHKMYYEPINLYRYKTEENNSTVDHENRPKKLQE